MVFASFQIDEDDIDDVGEMKKQESLNRYIVNALSGICNLLKKDIILHVVKVHNPEHLMGSKQSSKSEFAAAKSCVIPFDIT